MSYYVKPMEASVVLGVCYMTILNWMKRGQIPCRVLGKKISLIPRSWVEQYLGKEVDWAAVKLEAAKRTKERRYNAEPQ